MECTLFIIDSHAALYRHFFAMQGLRAPKTDNDSENSVATGAVFGFARMLHDMLRTHAPTALVAVFDAHAELNRKKLYSGYKANRPPQPPELTQQIEQAKEILDALRIPRFELPGWEADDLAGTLASQAGAAGWQTVLVTSDKDYGQLLDEHTSILKPGRKGEPDQHIDAQSWAREWGMPPSRLVDVMGLWGDASDNIPGVPGIGQKIGVQLIQQFGSLDDLLARADEIGGKRGEVIRAHKDQALLSRQLATIDRSAPITLDLDAARVREPDAEKLAAIYGRLGFSSLLPRIAQAAPQALPPAPTAAKGTYVLVDTPDAFEAFLTELRAQAEFAFDTETTGTDPLNCGLVGISFCWREQKGYYLPFMAPLGCRVLSKSDLARLQPIFEDPAVRKIGHNIRFDALVLRQYGITVQGCAFDTMIASSVIDGHLQEHGLKALARKHCGADMTPIEALIGSGRAQITMDRVPTDAVADYAGADADFSLRLRGVLDGRLDGRGARELFEQVEMPLSDVLTDMQAEGIRVDCALLARESDRTGDEILALEKEIHALAGHSFLISSPKQLGAVLFEEMGLPVLGKKGKTGPSTDESVLQDLVDLHGSAIAAKVLEWRMYAKLKNTYLDALPKMINPRTGRLHTSFSQVRTATGRLASSNPNLQNIPVRTERGRAVRAAFIPRDGWVMMAADYSQVELRVLAAFSQDPVLGKAFADGLDIHRVTAAAVNGIPLDAVTKEQRSAAKAVNFGILYGQSAFGLSGATGMTRAAAKEFIDGYFRQFPRVREWIDGAVQAAVQQGGVETILHFRREIPDLAASARNRRQRAEREAVNTIIQGSAADLIKTAMVRLARALRQNNMQARLLLQIHDELVLECPPAEVDHLRELVRDAMENALPLSVPLRVDIGVGPNWLAAK